MKQFLVLLIAVSAFNGSCQTKKMEATQSSSAQASSIHNFKVAALNGGVIDFVSFKGKKILIVNTASECGYTPQYKDLQELYRRYSDKLVVIGFPCNDFGGQEPGQASEISSFCSKNYQVSFPMAAKVEIKGDNVAPIYKWLTQKQLNGVMDATVTWNFNKFLLDEEGKLIGYYPSRVSPMSDDIVEKLKP